MFLLKDLFTQLFKQACSLTMRKKHNSDCKQANEVRAMRDAQKKTVLWKQVRVLSWELREIIRFVLENYICLFETLEFRERLHAQSPQVNSYSQMPEILDLLDFFSAQLTNCNVGPFGTEWHILVHVGIQLSPSFIH